MRLPEASRAHLGHIAFAVDPVARIAPEPPADSRPDADDDGFTVKSQEGVPRR